MKGKWRIVLLCPVLLAGALLCLRRGGEEMAAFAPTLRSAETLVIDAGHGGEDGGAVSQQGTVESQINLGIALKMEQMSGLFGVQTLLIRREDRSIHDPEAHSLRERKRSDLQNRVSLIQQAEPATLISIHQNSYSSPQYCGAQVFYGSAAAGKLLAEHTQRLLNQQLDPENHRQAARIPDSVYLMKHVSCPAILVECGFLTNPTEEQLLKTDTYQCKVAAVLLGAYLSFTPTEEGAGQ